MLRLLISLIGLVWMADETTAQTQSRPMRPDVANRIVQAALAPVVHNGKVDYATLKREPDALDRAVQAVAQARTTPRADAEHKAFYLNAYNILVLHSVVQHYPIATPMDVPGFFDKTKHTVGGEQMTLNELENELIRPRWQDPRIHFGLVCAAQSCPPLSRVAFLASNVNQQLELRTRKALANDAFIRLDAKQKKVLVSEMFKWYAEDFATQGVRAYLDAYRHAAGAELIPQDWALEYYPYNWQLNDVDR